MSTANPHATTNAQKPDLDWSQIRETVRMLNLAVAQIGSSLGQGTESVGALTNSFTSMAGTIQVIASAAEALPDDGNGNEVVIKRTIAEKSGAVGGKMRSAIIALQFYDRMTQRLDHVSSTLTALADLVEDPERLYSPFEWKGLQERIMADYSTPEERALFDAVMKGKSVKEAVKELDEKAKAEAHLDSVELF